MSTDLQGYPLNRRVPVRKDGKIKVNRVEQTAENEVLAAALSCTHVFDHGYTMTRMDPTVHESRTYDRQASIAVSASASMVHYFATFMAVPLRGRMIGEWARMVSFMDAKDIQMRNATLYEAWIKTTPSILVSPSVLTPKVSGTSAANSLVDMINIFRDAYRMPLDNANIEAMDKLLAVLAEVDVSKKVTGGKKDDDDAEVVQYDNDLVTSIWTFIAQFASIHQLITSGVNNTRDINVEWVDILKMANDDQYDKMLDLFIRDQHTQVYLKHLLEAVKIVPAYLISDKGYVRLGRAFYEAIITYILKGVVEALDKYKAALVDVERFEKERKKLREQWAIQQTSKYKPDVPLELMIGPVLAAGTSAIVEVAQNRADEQAAVEHFKSKYAKVIPLFVEMVQAWFKMGVDDFAPTVTYRKTITQGSDTIYSLIFHDGYAPAGDIMALRYASRTDGTKETFTDLDAVEHVAHYELATMPRSSIDRNMVQSFLHDDIKTKKATYDYNQMSSEYERYYRQSRKEYSVIPASTDDTKYKLIANDEFFSVRPPSEKAYEIILMDGGVKYWAERSRDFELRTLKIAEASLVELYFSIRVPNIDRSPEKMDAFFQGRLKSIQAMNFIGAEYAKCDVSWNKAVIPSIALLLATLGYRDASMARSIVRERIKPPGVKSFDADKLPPSSFTLMAQVKRKITVAFPMAMQNIFIDDPRFKDNKDFYFASGTADPVQLQIHRQPYYPGVKGLDHIKLCTINLDLADDVVVRGSVRALMTAETLRIKLPSTLPRMSSWPNADYALFYLAGGRNYADLFEFEHASTDVLGTIATLYVALVSQGTQKLGDRKALSRQFSDLADWIRTNLNLEAHIQDAFPLMGDKTWAEFTRNCESTKALLEASSTSGGKGTDTEALLKIWEGIFDVTFPAYLSAGLPLYYVDPGMSVTLLLDDKMKGVGRFQAQDSFVEMIAPTAPFSAFKDPGIAYSILKAYTEHNLRACFSIMTSPGV